MDLLPTDTTLDVREHAVPVALLPIGSLAQHGPHLPLTTDTVVAATLAAGIAAEYPARLLPPVTFSCTHEYAAWPGTVSISATTLIAIVNDVAASLHRGGVTRLVLVNGYSGNHVLADVVQEASLGPVRMALFPAAPDWEAARRGAGLATPPWADSHAGELETSILLHAHPHLVAPPSAREDEVAADVTRPVPVTSGVVGVPAAATARKGRDVLASLVRSFAGYLGDAGP